MSAATCRAPHNAGAACSFGGAVFDVVFTSPSGAEIERHPACFMHAVTETERHYAAEGIARCEMVGPVREPTENDQRDREQHLAEGVRFHHHRHQED